jgi:molybdopterin-guanine dinucleotide biosynthesis protein A
MTTAPDGRPEPPPRPVIAGVLLAGGQSRRMGGGDKCLRSLAGRPILSHVLARVASQVDALLLNANGDPNRFADFGLPVAGDSVEGFAGPLAGVLTGLEWAEREVPDCRWVASFACDAPFVPVNLVTRLWAEVQEAGADMACASSRGRDHPVFGLWPLDRKDDLRRALEEGVRKVDQWTGRYRLVKIDFPDLTTSWGPLDPFFNTNRPEDLEEAARCLLP